MRRSLTLSLLVLAATPCPGVSAAATQPARPRPGPPGPSRPARPSIAASPNPSAAGERMLISGRVHGAGSAHTTVGMWQRQPWQQSYHRLARTHTDASGRYSFTLRPDTNRNLYVIGGRQHSRTVHLHVRALVTLLTPSSTPDTGETTTFTGGVMPRHGGHYVTIEQRQGTRWVRLGRPRLDSHSAFRFTHIFTIGGAHILRASFSGDDKNARATSAPMLLGVLAGIHKIQHVVIIMQENRSFDTYFGTYPGADGIPSTARLRSRPGDGQLRRAVPRRADKNFGGPHGAPAFTADVNGGQMDGFVKEAESGTKLHGQRPGVQPLHSGQTAVQRRHGLPRRARDPELLDLRARLRPAGPHVRAERVLEPARAPLWCPGGRRSARNRRIRLVHERAPEPDPPSALPGRLRPAARSTRGPT